MTVTNPTHQLRSIPNVERDFYVDDLADDLQRLGPDASLEQVRAVFARHERPHDDDRRHLRETIESIAASAALMLTVFALVIFIGLTITGAL